MNTRRMHQTQMAIPKLKFDVINRNKRKNSDTNIHTARNTSIDYLSHTFRAFHAQVQENKRDRSQYTSDLEKTSELNFEIINSLIPSLQLDKKYKVKLIEKIKVIHQFHDKKKTLIKTKASIRSKVLVDLQINEETKRRKEELNDYQVEKKEEQKASIEKKTISIKRFQRKFNEVETYIQKESQLSSKYKNKFTKYEIIPFLYTNETYNISIDILTKDIKNISNNIMMITKENNQLKERENFINEKPIENEKDTVKQQECDNYQQIIQSYDSKIKHYLINNRQLKNQMNEINKQINAHTLQKIIFEEQNLYTNINKEEQTLCMRYTEENLNESPHLVTLNNSQVQFKWDISCIEKTEENQ